MGGHSLHLPVPSTYLIRVLTIIIYIMENAYGYINQGVTYETFHNIRYIAYNQSISSPDQLIGAVLP